MITLKSPRTYTFVPQEIKSIAFRLSDELNNQYLSFVLDRKLILNGLVILNSINYTNNNIIELLIKNDKITNDQTMITADSIIGYLFAIQEKVIKEQIEW